MWPSTWQEVRGDASNGSVEGLCREEKEIDIWKLSQTLSEKQNSLVWHRKLNWLFKENAQLRKGHLRLRQKWTKEIGNKEMLILLFVKPIDNSNLKDWSGTKQIGGLIRLKERRLIYAETWN